MTKPFKLNVSKDILQEINLKVKNYSWHEMPDDGGWEYGTNLEYMKEISNYWVNTFNWKKQEEEINKFSNYITVVDDIEIHYILEKGSGPKSTPLLLMHGWPGSVVEFLHIIQKIVHQFHDHPFQHYHTNLIALYMMVLDVPLKLKM